MIYLLLIICSDAIPDNVPQIAEVAAVKRRQFRRSPKGGTIYSMLGVFLNFMPDAIINCNVLDR